jgi:hypothetical protein
VAVGVTTVGVPEMVPVEELKLRPVGSVGPTKKVGEVPLTDGVSVVMATPMVVLTDVTG